MPTRRKSAFFGVNNGSDIIDHLELVTYRYATKFCVVSLFFFPPRGKPILLLAQILSRILSFLSFADVHDARLVCKKFYEASLATDIVDKERVDFGKLSSHHNLDERVLLESKRDFFHFHFEVS